MLLAIDTSTRYAAIALVDQNHVLYDITWEVGQRHSTELMEQLQRLFTAYSIDVSALDGVAVATGPGSFNGLRVALATAKALAFAGGIPLYGHPTLDVIAWGAASAPVTIAALLDAGRGHVYAARYAGGEVSAADWSPLDGYRIVTPKELAEEIRGPVLFCGEWREDTQTALRGLLGPDAHFATGLGGRRASWLAELAQARAANGSQDASDDPAALEPLYLRRPAITTSAKVALQPENTTYAALGDSEQSGEGASGALRR